ncbi:MAG: type I restriction enzyme, S subunit [Methanolobus sp. T82-4]|nr:MAG: type I restriction enzyme, S subunit [Methanolobus sp. T82-4]
MIHDLKPYPAYKDSGVPWLGKVPEHWEVKRLKRCSERFYSGGTPDSGNAGYYCNPPEGLPWLMIADMTREKHVKKTVKAITEKGRASKNLEILPKGTILYSIYASLGTVSILEIEAAVNQAIIGIKFRESDLKNKFAYYYLDSLSPHLSLMSNSNTQANLNAEKVRSLPVFLPPLTEQSAIVRYLDYMDQRISRYIHAKQNLIKLLEEQKQAIIHRSIIRGLDAGVKLKHSGLELLGDIPEHWEIKPAKYYYKEIDERSSSGSEELLSVSHITGVTPRSEKNVNMFMAESYVGYKICKENDLVINTMWAWAGALGIAKQTGIVSYSYAVYRPIKKDLFLRQFIDLLLRTKPYIDEYVCRSTGIRSSRLRLYPEQFLRIPIIQPPIDEQKAILGYINNHINNLDELTRTTQREIALIKEYRTRLISDVVTGKLDVRKTEKYLFVDDNHIENNDEAAIEEFDSDDFDAVNLNGDSEEEYAYDCCKNI